MPAIIAKGKFQGGITQLIALPGKLDGRRRPGQSQRLPRIKLQEVDGLGDIGIGLNPILAHFVGQPGAKFKLALANQLRRLQQQRHALPNRRVLPARESLMRRVYRPLGMFQPGLLVYTDNLRWPRRVQRLDLFRGAHPLPTDDEFILVTEHVRHTRQRSVHRAHVFIVVEVDKGFVAEQSFGSNRLNHGADLGSRHNTIILRPDPSYRVAVIRSVCADILAVRSSLSQLKGRPSIARFTVLKSTREKSCR
jgi:hypothetical protein